MRRRARPFPLLAALLAVAAAQAAATPAKEFTAHRAVTPRLVHAATGRSIDHTVTNDTSKHHVSAVTLIIDHFTIDLKLNENLIPDQYFEKFHQQGETVTRKFSSRRDVELCHYQGKLRGVPNSWAAVSTCDGVRGTFFDGREVHHIEKAPDDPNVHFMYANSQHRDHVPINVTQRVRRSVGDDDENKAAGGDGSDGRRKVIDGPWNANTQSRYVELLLVVDHKEYVDHGKDLQKIYRICKDVANVMNALYSPLNIYIALVGVVVWTEYDEITLSSNGDTTLTNFLHYRRERLVKDHPNDNAQLLTGAHFEGGVVGKALKGPMCTFEFSGGVNMWHSDVIGLLATTVAHEMGHNFGMEHDTEDCVCPDERCIMAPASSTLKPTFWSSCSLEHLALAFEHGMDYCLRNKPTALFDSPTCGNGFVEEGEACDCGLKNHCDNPCCNPETCTLFANATCATGECCDMTTCKPKVPGSLCRRADHECDLPEFCTGQSEFCPEDVFKVDGTSCKVGQAFCFRGSCRTHSDQCKLLWGPSGKKSDNQCYEQNRKGSRHGNCGYDRLTGAYVACSEEDVRCGMLHCSHLNERLEFGMESVAILSHSFINSGGKIIPCRTALVDLGLNDVDPGLSPEGARCGEGHLCVNQKCMEVASLTIGPNSCPNDCNGNGVCNSRGHCHCQEGFSPPYCDAYGPGGSVDSGPASDPNSDSSTTRIVLLVLLPLLLLFLLLLLLVYLRRRGDWRLLLEKAKPSQTSGLVSSERKMASRKLDISAPVAVESGPSSPTTRALLPHVDTTATVVSDSTTDADPADAESGTSKKNSALLSRSAARPSKLSFMQSVARSISFPSPKLSKAIRSRDGAKYELTVEHRRQEDLGQDQSPVGTPTETEPPHLRPTLGDSAQPWRPEAAKPPAPERPKVPPRPKTIVLETASSSPAAASSQNVPAEKPRPLTVPVIPPPDIANNPKLAFPHSSSFTSSGSLRLATSTITPSISLGSGAIKSAAEPDQEKRPLSPPRVAKKPNLALAAESAPEASITTSKPVQSPFFRKSSSTSGSGDGNKKGDDASKKSDDSSKTATLPANLTSPLSSGGTTKSLTLPSGVGPPDGSGARVRPEIGRPILQTATSSATELISKAASTGVSQSSILTRPEKPERRDRSSRGVVFCDPLTLPSPTQPQLPPIIHQPVLPVSVAAVSKDKDNKAASEGLVMSKATTATIVTPTWSVEPKPLSSDAVICHIDAPDGADSVSSPAEAEHAPIASPESEAVGGKGGLSKIKAKLPHVRRSASLAEKDPPVKSERGSFRNLEISGPILQSSIELKTKLVPVCSSEASSTSASPTPSSPVPSRSAPPPPIHPRAAAKPKVPLKPAQIVPSSPSLSTWSSPSPSERQPVTWRTTLTSISAPRGSASGESSRGPAEKAEEREPLVQRQDSLSKSSKRPASIATSRPVRPTAPPPPRPPTASAPTHSGVGSSHVYDECPEEESAGAKGGREPIYDTIKESPSPEKEVMNGGRGASASATAARPSSIAVTSPQDEQDFVTPTTSPLFARRSPDTLSTASSSEGDLLKEILKEMDVKEEDESVYSTLMRKKKRKQRMSKE